MAGQEKPPRLKVSFSRDELDMLARAAALDTPQHAELAAWARRVLLDHARPLIEKDGTLDPDSEANAAEPKAAVHDTGLKCNCGHTHHPHGNCDGSCLGLRW